MTGLRKRFEDGAEEDIVRAFGFGLAEFVEGVARDADEEVRRGEGTEGGRGGAMGGKVEAVNLTEAEGVYLSMLWAQEAYKPSLRKAGFGEDAQMEIETGLSDAAKQLRGWLATRYAEGYAPLARQFRNMFGVDLPQWTRGVDGTLDALLTMEHE